MIRIMTLMENQPGARKGLTAEHGLSFLIDVDGRRILFDCGSGEGILRNMPLLGAAPASVGVMGFSHSHYHHAAGFPYLAEHGRRAAAGVGGWAGWGVGGGGRLPYSAGRGWGREVGGARGSRHYGSAEVDRLQQVLLYREAEMPLSDIKRLLDDPSFDARTSPSSS